MSFVERLWFRMTNDPASDKAWKKQRDETKAVCDAEIAEWNKKLEKTKDTNFINKTLPDDLTYVTKFIKDRIKILKTYTLSAAAIDALNTNQDAEHFNIMMATLMNRYTFKTQIDNAITQWTTIIKDLETKKQKVPPTYHTLLKRIQNELPWFNKQKFVEAEVYDTQFKHLVEDAGTILQGTGAALHDSDKSLKAAESADDAARNEFSITRLVGSAVGIIITILTTFLIFLGGVYGSSLATNLNLHHNAAYRVLYAIFGFLFFFLVIPYVLLYRWWWKGKKPRFYSLIPLVPYHFDNYYAGLLFSWMSYRPDDRVQALKEWELEHKI